MYELRKAWLTYERRVVPKDAPPIQTVECRRAYFHGCSVVLEVLEKLDDANPFERKRILEGLKAEGRQFLQEVAADRA
jgi:hypothetical protein